MYSMKCEIRQYEIFAGICDECEAFGPNFDTRHMLWYITSNIKLTTQRSSEFPDAIFGSMWVLWNQTYTL